MYIWLENGAEEQLQALKEQGLVGDLQVEIDRISGKKHIVTYTDVSDPTSEIPECLGELTERVTAKDRIVHGFRVEGVYRHNGATLTVKTAAPANSQGWQWVNISGPSVEAVKTIYSLVRQGKLTPEENWEEWTPIIPPATEPAEDTEKAEDTEPAEDTEKASV